jgi:capsular exopolysaccharide synthesis family protein
MTLTSEKNGNDLPPDPPRIKLLLPSIQNGLKRCWWILPVCILLGGLASILMQHFAPREYESLGRMIVSIKLNIQQGAIYSEELNNFLGTQAALMRSEEIRARTQRRLAEKKPTLLASEVNLDVAIVPKTSIFVLRASSKNPDYAQGFLQACMEEYIELKKEMVVRTTDTTTAGLTDKILQLESILRASDKEIELFLSTNNAALVEEASGVSSFLIRMYEQLSAAQAEQSLLQALTPEQSLLLEETAASVHTTPGQSSGTLAETSTDRNDITRADSGYLQTKRRILMLQAEESRDAHFLKPKHPRMLALAKDITDAEELLRIHQQQNAQRLEVRKKSLGLQIETLQAQIKDFAAQNLSLSHKTVEYSRLKGKAQRIQTLYDQLLTTLQTLDVTRDINPESVTIYQNASPAAAATKSLLGTAAIGCVAGLLGGIALLAVVIRLDDRINTALEIEQSFDEPLLGHIPYERSARNGSSEALLKADDPRHAFVESYRGIRSNLWYARQQGTQRHGTVLITSTQPNEGKSLTAANLAITLATGKTKVLLIDADLRSGRLHEVFGVQSSKGLTEALTQGISWHSLVQSTGYTNLDILQCGERTMKSGALFLTSAVDQLLSEAGKSYEWVILDTVPVMAADDVTSLAPRVDGVVFLLRAGVSSAMEAHTALRMLRQRGARTLGIILNAARSVPGSTLYYGYQAYGASYVHANRNLRPNPSNHQSNSDI